MSDGPKDTRPASSPTATYPELLGAVRGPEKAAVRPGHGLLRGVKICQHRLDRLSADDCQHAPKATAVRVQGQNISVFEEKSRLCPFHCGHQPQGSTDVRFLAGKEPRAFFTVAVKKRVQKLVRREPVALDMHGQQLETKKVVRGHSAEQASACGRHAIERHAPSHRSARGWARAGTCPAGRSLRRQLHTLLRAPAACALGSCRCQAVSTRPPG